MEDLKQAIAELNITYDKVSDLVGTNHPVSKRLAGIIRDHSTGNAHQIVKERMSQKKAQPQKEGVAGKVKAFFNSF